MEIAVRLETQTMHMNWYDGICGCTKLPEWEAGLCKPSEFCSVLMLRKHVTTGQTPVQGVYNGTKQ